MSQRTFVVLAIVYAPLGIWIAWVAAWNTRAGLKARWRWWQTASHAILGLVGFVSAMFIVVGAVAS